MVEPLAYQATMSQNSTLSSALLHWEAEGRPTMERESVEDLYRLCEEEENPVYYRMAFYGRNCIDCHTCDYWLLRRWMRDGLPFGEEWVREQAQDSPLLEWLHHCLVGDQLSCLQTLMESGMVAISPPLALCLGWVLDPLFLRDITSDLHPIEIAYCYLGSAQEDLPPPEFHRFYPHLWECAVQDADPVLLRLLLQAAESFTPVEDYTTPLSVTLTPDQPPGEWREALIQSALTQLVHHRECSQLLWSHSENGRDEESEDSEDDSTD